MSRIDQSGRTSITAPLLWLLIVTLLGACRPVDPSLELEGEAPAETDAGAQALSTTSRMDRHPRLVVLHTNDTWGYYDPCG